MDSDHAISAFPHSKVNFVNEDGNEYDKTETSKLIAPFKAFVEYNHEDLENDSKDSSIMIKNIRLTPYTPDNNNPFLERTAKMNKVIFQYDFDEIRITHQHFIYILILNNVYIIIFSISFIYSLISKLSSIHIDVMHDKYRFVIHLLN